MTKPCIFVLGLGIGAWTVPIAQRIAAHLSSEHYLAIKE